MRIRVLNAQIIKLIHITNKPFQARYSNTKVCLKWHNKFSHRVRGDTLTLTDLELI